MTTAAGLVVLLCLCPRSAAASAAQPNALVRQVVNSDRKAEEQDHSHWMFRLVLERPDAQKEVDEVIETASGDLKRPILINGRKLTLQEQQQRVEQLVKDPKALRKSLKDKNQDAARSQQLLKMLPDAFIFSYGKRRGDLVQLKCTPNPHFRPPNREGAVFHAMAGSLWVDSKQLRIAEISGHLLHKVKFGGGLLGHLDEGGEFDVKQAEVASVIGN